ncbi:MAG TPA: isoprenylcysteine carboxylmethyltransferase family protein [Erysipelotrichaceae bacterium]|nr:isoprenylcysteine carboxylmethyltransferase family protein [Erysipelotrichaceae bacterium]
MEEGEKVKLLIEALIKFSIGLILVMVLLFVPAGTVRYFNGWLFIALLFIPMIFFGAYLYFKAPELLRKRLKNQEKEEKQKLAISISGIVFIASFVLSGLDYRFGWTKVSGTVVAVSSILLLAGYLIYMEVMRENAYLSRVVEVVEGQVIVDSGLYGIVRHPMYSATLLIFLAMPLVLGSYIGFVIMLVYPYAMVIRIRNEEEILEKELLGYSEYKKRVKYRLIPFIW